jgi:hypothetical protein
MRPAVRRDDAAALSTSSADRQTHRERRMARQHASMRTRQRVHSITTTPRRLLHWRCSLRRRRCWPPQFSCACGRFTQKELPSNAYEHSYIHTNRCLRPRRAGAGGNVQGHCAAASPWRAVPRALQRRASRPSRWKCRCHRFLLLRVLVHLLRCSRRCVRRRVRVRQSAGRSGSAHRSPLLPALLTAQRTHAPAHFDQHGRNSSSGGGRGRSACLRLCLCVSLAGLRQRGGWSGRQSRGRTGQHADAIRTMG